MAAKSKTKKTGKAKPVRRIRPFRLLLRVVMILFVVAAALILLNRWIDPPRGIYMRAEAARLGHIDWQPVDADQIAPVMLRSVIAAEDANFCQHWGFDVGQIRLAIDQGGGRGASTLTQQTVKNVYLWHGRTWLRKALEAALTPVVEALWPKRRILELYLNRAEFDTGVFGVEAAARSYFGVSAADLSAKQAARLAAVLPDPKGRSASKPTNWVRKRTAAIMDGAALIKRDGRATCIKD